MIPFILHRDYDYDSSIISYKNGDYPYAETDVQGLKTRFMKKIWYNLFEHGTARIFPRKGIVNRIVEPVCTALDTLPWLLRYGKKVDVLQVYHLKDETVLIGFLYKIINPKGVLYMKLDLHPNIMDAYKKDPESFEKKAPLPYRAVKFDLITVESRQLYDFIRTKHRFFRENVKSLYYLPNGINLSQLPQHVLEINKREDVILHAGRLGNINKGTEIVLEVFSKVAGDFPTWKLILIGDMEEQFVPKLNAFMHDHANIKDRIINPGFLKTRKELFEIYGKSKIFIFPSKPESFGLVVLEAASMGMAFLGSDIPSTRDMTDDGRLGYLCPVDDVRCFERSLRHMMSNQDELIEKTGELTEFTRLRFDWTDICNHLQQKINEKISKQANSEDMGD
jgi:glycosyltransferase involved in cell wall biosynthesis